MDVTAETGPIAHNTRALARLDIAGGGQVTVDGDYAYVGHMAPPHGTTILDISDPRAPRIVATIELEGERAHSHKVRVAGDLMVVNSERAPGYTGPFEDGGFAIYNISDRTEPRQIRFERTHAKGVHRFDMDENYLYLSTEMEGFHGRILAIYDISDPARPDKVSQWWLPGQEAVAGEEPPPRDYRLHHALRFGDRLWAGCLGAGLAVVDVSDIRAPRTLGHYNYHPPFREPSHTFMPAPFKVDGREIALAIDEEGPRPRTGQPHAFMWVFNVTDPADMRPLATYQVDEAASPYAGAARETGKRYGAHQFRERMTDTLVYATWFAAGLRIVDVADPDLPEEAGWFIPAPGRDGTVPQTNDVDVDDRGLIYVLDRNEGLDVVEYVPHA